MINRFSCMAFEIHYSFMIIVLDLDSFPCARKCYLLSIFLLGGSHF